MDMEQQFKQVGHPIRKENEQNEDSLVGLRCIVG